MALGADYKAEYNLSTVAGKPFPWGIAGERWAELVKEKTKGRINIKGHAGTSLIGGDQTKEFTAIRQGVIGTLMERIRILSMNGFGRYPKR
jgi:TRAP-type C4-dicarboxylate transport system substrate-binding protein